MATPKMVIVPQTMLDELEQARKLLFKMHPEDIEDIDHATLSQLLKISEPMWLLTNTKWDEVK